MEPSSSSPRYFTLEEANSLLPRLRSLLERLRRDAATVEGLEQALQEGGQSLGRASRAGTNGHGRDGAGPRFYAMLQEADEAVKAMQAALREIEDLGCVVKDVTTGLVDFRTIRDGRAVYLCWRLGEDVIRYWHELDAGFAGRRPL
jgi:hypothetical protein